MKVIETKNAPGAIGPYSQGYISNGFVFTSGQIPVDPQNGAIPEGIEATTDKMDLTPGASTATEGEDATGEGVDGENAEGDAADATQP